MDHGLRPAVSGIQGCARHLQADRPTGAVCDRSRQDPPSSPDWGLRQAPAHVGQSHQASAPYGALAIHFGPRLYIARSTVTNSTKQTYEPPAGIGLGILCPPFVPQALVLPGVCPAGRWSARTRAGKYRVKISVGSYGWPKQEDQNRVPR